MNRNDKLLAGFSKIGKMKYWVTKDNKKTLGKHSVLIILELNIIISLIITFLPLRTIF